MGVTVGVAGGTGVGVAGGVTRIGGATMGGAGSMTGTLSANERGTRPGLSCSLGSGDMAWAQSYTATVTQRLSAADRRRPSPRL